MNILITGSKGFIGRNLSRQLSAKYNVTELHRGNCNLLDPESVSNFFQNSKQKYDLVLHTAIEGGRRTDIDTRDIVYHNILMLYNLLSYQNYFQCIISFGSGAELDRRYDINANSTNRYPVDPYGLSKSLIYKLCASEPKLCSFRIFNCFGIDEQPDRMIRHNITKYLNKETMIIHQNKKMDFFYIEDLSKMIDSFIEHNHIPKDFDCCYAEKYTLLDIANMINQLDDHKVDITIQDNTISSPAKDYIGIPMKMNINFIGLKNAIKIMYGHYKEMK